MKLVKSKAHTAPYIIHKYFARRPYSVFEHLVTEYSSKGDIIYDPFSGGGVSVYESVRQNRKAIGCDINPLSKFIIEKMVLRDEGDLFYEKINYLYDFLDNLYEKHCSVECECGKSVVPELMEAYYIAECSNCHEPIEFSNRNKVKTATYHCNNCSHDSTASKCKRIGSSYLTAEYYCGCQKKFQKTTLTQIQIEKVMNGVGKLKGYCDKHGIDWPKDEIPDYWDRQAEDGLRKKGFRFFCDLFTQKNLLVNACLLNEIKKLDVSQYTYENLRLVFSSSLKDTSRLSMVTDDWQQGKPVTWSKHAYWIPSQFCEVNVKSAFKRAADRFIKSCLYNKDNLDEVKLFNNTSSFFDSSSPSVLLLNQDSASVSIPAESVDLILTDPPYGSNVQYNELSSYWHVWNKDLYESNYYEPREAVVNRKKNIPNSKTFEHYEAVLSDIMFKSYEVLKNKSYMILTFNNNNFKSWISILFSICKAGFLIEEDKLHFQTGIKNYKQTAHTISNGTIHGDFILFFKKDFSQKLSIQNDHLEELTLSIKTSLLAINSESFIEPEQYKAHFVFYYKELLPKLWIYLNSIDKNMKIDEITLELFEEN
ncbi:MAG: DNA modification methylase [Psychroserpens sp.]|jgi:DNA modification methylase